MENFDEAMDVIRFAGKRRKGCSVIGIAGGSCSGKTTFVQLAVKQMDGSVLSMDDYYKSADIIDEKFDHNFDEPASIDMELLASHIQELKNSIIIKKPIYDFKTHQRSGYELFFPAKIVLVEGLFSLHESIRNHLDAKIYVDCDDETRLERRLERDIRERQRTRESVMHQYERTVKPMHYLHVEPTKMYADVIVVNTQKLARV